MNKSNNNFIFKALGVMAVLAFGVVMTPTNASAWNGYAFQSETIQRAPDPLPINPVPAIYSVNPTSIVSGSGSKVVTISGINFVPTSVARFNGAERVTTYVDPSTLTMRLTDNDVAGRGDYMVIVYNPLPGGGFSNAKFVTLGNTGSSSAATNATLGYASTTNTSSTTGYSSSSFGGSSSNTVAKAPVKKTTTTKTVAKTNTTTDTNNTVAKSTTDNSLAANAVFGDGSFLPDTFVEWAMLFILILLAIVLWRRIWVTDEQKHAPLKHA
ncbi:MAG: hypothetical protein AAB438_00395 [Patescibacteria group bacterium]